MLSTLKSVYKLCSWHLKNVLFTIAKKYPYCYRKLYGLLESFLFEFNIFLFSGTKEKNTTLLFSIFNVSCHLAMSLLLPSALEIVPCIIVSLKCHTKWRSQEQFNKWALSSIFSQPVNVVNKYAFWSLSGNVLLKDCDLIIY